MPQIRPITDLRDTNEISEICHSNSEPIFITKNGYGDLVVMSIETYEKLVEGTKPEEIVTEAEPEYKAGTELFDAKEALSSLRKLDIPPLLRNK